MKTSRSLHPIPHPSRPSRARAGLQMLYLLAIAIGLFTGMLTAWSATYQMYFNNTEQGANSTANPSLSVQGGVAKKSSGTEESGAPTVGGAEVSSVASPVTATPSGSTFVQTPPAATVANDPYDRAWRLGVGGGYIRGIGDYTTGLALNLTWAFHKNLALSALLGVDRGWRQSYGGTELAITPFTIGVGSLSHLLEPSLLLGVAVPFERDLEDWEPHAGVKVKFQLDPAWSVEASARANLRKFNFAGAYFGGVVGLNIHL